MATAGSQEEGVTLLILYSSGDLGDVGRHCVSLALQHPLVRRVRVVTDQPAKQLFCQADYKKCACSPIDHDLLAVKDKLQIFPVQDDLLPHVVGADAVISCLGNRQPFHADSNAYIAQNGTELLVQAILDQPPNRRRLIVLSSVGIGNDWPPLSGLREGNFLAGLFRTICWHQYQDLSRAERAVHRTWSNKQIDYVTARCVVLPDEQQPQGAFRAVVQSQQPHQQIEGGDGSKQRQDIGDDEQAARAGYDYDPSIAKLDAARFLVQEAVHPTLHRQVVILGGEPPPLSEEEVVTEPSASTSKIEATATASSNWQKFEEALWNESS